MRIKLWLAPALALPLFTACFYGGRGGGGGGGSGDRDRCEVQEDCADDEFCDYTDQDWLDGGWGPCVEPHERSIVVGMLGASVGATNPLTGGPWDPEDGTAPDIGAVFFTAVGDVADESTECTSAVVYDTRYPDWSGYECVYNIDRGEAVIAGLLDYDAGGVELAGGLNFSAGSGIAWALQRSLDSAAYGGDGFVDWVDDYDNIMVIAALPL